nr:hypothetical protein Itr_chr12CG25110 [Ipomoea trifida]
MICHSATEIHVGKIKLLHSSIKAALHSSPPAVMIRAVPGQSPISKLAQWINQTCFYQQQNCPLIIGLNFSRNNNIVVPAKVAEVQGEDYEHHCNIQLHLLFLFSCLLNLMISYCFMIEDGHNSEERPMMGPALVRPFELQALRFNPDFNPLRCHNFSCVSGARSPYIGHNPGDYLSGHSRPESYGNGGVIQAESPILAQGFATADVLVCDAEDL